MKKLILLFGFILLLAACKKNDPAPNSNTSNGNNGSSGNNNNSNNTNTTITYINNTFTPIVITVNNNKQTINPGSNITYSSAPGSAAVGTATTSGHTTSGTVVGLTLSYTINDVFPQSGNLNSNLNVTSNYFFLKIQNTSSVTAIKLYVNYLLTAQTVDNIQIPNDGVTYSIGYYSAYTNSNVRLESSSSYWYWASLPFTNTTNQSVTLNATN